MNLQGKMLKKVGGSDLSGAHRLEELTMCKHPYYTWRFTTIPVKIPLAPFTEIDHPKFV
jgi:hypothetical protein